MYTRLIKLTCICHYFFSRFQVDASKDIKLTRAQVRLQVVRLAKSLQALDVKEGDVIGICSENGVEYPILAYAIFCLGATIAPLNVTYTDRKCLQVKE